jgi:hypothetical protein
MAIQGRIMMRTCILGAVAVWLVASQAADAAWKKYSYPADGFEVEFSGEISVKPTPVSAETQKQISRSTAYLQDGGDYAYIVNASLHKGAVNFESGIKASFGALKCKTTGSDRPLSFPSGRGRELSGDECGDGNMRAEARYFTTGKWFYQVLYVIRRDGGDPEIARHFLNSFKPIGK